MPISMSRSFPRTIVVGAVVGVGDGAAMVGEAVGTTTGAVLGVVWSHRTEGIKISTCKHNHHNHPIRRSGDKRIWWWTQLFSQLPKFLFLLFRHLLVVAIGENVDTSFPLDLFIFISF